MASLSSSAIVVLAIQILIVLLILRRQILIYQGTPVSGARIALGAGLILFLFALIELTGYAVLGSAFPNLGWAVLGNVAIVAVASFAFARVAERQARVWKDPRGFWMYQMGLGPAILYVGLYFARLGLEFAFFPSLLQFQTGGVSSQTTVLQLVILEVVAALVAISSGILVGRGIGVYRRVQQLERSSPAPPPLVSQSPPAK
jgi:hypothetical protein